MKNKMHISAIMSSADNQMLATLIISDILTLEFLKKL